jgi:hypothetical protein
VNSRFAYELCKGRCARLAQLLGTFYVSGTPLCWTTENALLTIVVGFGGKIGHAQAVGCIADALEGVGQSTKGLDQRVRTALANGSVWAPGQAWKEPSADARRWILSLLEPDVVAKAVAAYVGGKDEIRFEPLAEHLRGLGLVGDTIADNRIVSGCLLAIGWQQRTLGPRTARFRAWVGPAWVPPVERPALPAVRPGHVTTANAPPVCAPPDPGRFDDPAPAFAASP